MIARSCRSGPSVVSRITTATSAAETTHCINNTGGTKGVDNAGGPKRGRGSLDEVRGADRITRSRSMASGRGDNSDGLAQGSAGPAGAEGGPVVRSARSSDWAAYLIREGQNARLEAWRNNHGLCGLFARAGTRSWVPTLHIS